MPLFFLDLSLFHSFLLEHFTPHKPNQSPHINLLTIPLNTEALETPNQYTADLYLHVKIPLRKVDDVTTNVETVLPPEVYDRVSLFRNWIEATLGWIVESNIKINVP